MLLLLLLVLLLVLPQARDPQYVQLLSRVLDPVLLLTLQRLLDAGVLLPLPQVRPPALQRELLLPPELQYPPLDRALRLLQNWLPPIPSHPQGRVPQCCCLYQGPRIECQIIRFDNRWRVGD